MGTKKLLVSAALHAARLPQHTFQAALTDKLNISEPNTSEPNHAERTWPTFGCQDQNERKKFHFILLLWSRHLAAIRKYNFRNYQ